MYLHFDLIYKWLVKPIAISENIETLTQRNFYCRAKFTIDQKIMVKRNFKILMNRLTKLGYQEFRTVSSVMGIDYRDLRTFAYQLAERISDHQIKIIHGLTSQNDPFSLVSGLGYSVNMIPNSILHIIQDINSSKTVKSIPGCSGSMIYFVESPKVTYNLTKTTINFTSGSTLESLHKLKYIYDTMSIEDIVTLNSMQDLFIPSNLFLSASIKHIEDGSLNINIGPNYLSENFIKLLEYNPYYEFDDRDFISQLNHTINPSDLEREILLSTSSRDELNNVNLYSNSPMAMEYSESLATFQNKTVNYKGSLTNIQQVENIGSNEFISDGFSPNAESDGTVIEKITAKVKPKITSKQGRPMPTSKVGGGIKAQQKKKEIGTNKNDDEIIGSELDKGD